MIRKIALLSACSLLMLAPFASQAKKEVSDYDLHKCVVSQNCSVVPGHCPGEYVAVNMRYENATRAKFKEASSLEKCAGKVPSKKLLDAVCIKNQCTLSD